MTYAPSVTPEKIAETIGMPIETWHGKCYFVAIGMLDKKLIEGELMTGFFHWGDDVTDHGWIKLPNGSVCDPTRWTLTDEQPHIYYGETGIEYDEEGIRWEKEQKRIVSKLFARSDAIEKQFDKIREEISNELRAETTK